MTEPSTARPETPVLHSLLVYRVLGRPLMRAALMKPARDHGASTGLLKTEERRAESKELVTQEKGHAGSLVLVTGEKDDAESEALE